VALPAVEKAAHLPGDRRDEMTEPALRTLVVEDDSVARRLIHEVLQLRGHQVTACADGETGWAGYQRDQPHLVLLDLNLPGMDGIDLCRRIRKVPTVHEPVVLFISSVENREALERALEVGADDYLLKPVNDRNLYMRLRIAERRVREIRERKELESRLREDALRDPLTGLVNRSFLAERIGHALRRAQRGEEYRFALLQVDLFDFGAVNDRFGREAGDAVLDAVARRLEDTVRSVDCVARISADTFGILLDGLSDGSDPCRVALRINEDLSAPFRIGDDSVQTAACIGIALSGSGYEDPEEVLKDAHIAVGEAKRHGPGTYRMYDPVLHTKAVARLELEARIRTAVQEDQMKLYYQPVVRVDSGRIAGFEALLRWEDPARGPISAEQFIPVAEKSALIMLLGSWVLDRVVDQLQEWQSDRNGSEPYFMSMNVSGRQFSQPDLADQIANRLDSVGLERDLFHVEITETSLMEKVDVAGRILSSLRDRSIHVHIDDFGTGYSSLSYLSRFPIDTLKIDRSFVAEMHDRQETLEVVRTIVHLAHTLGMSVVAEGVETEAQLDLLRKMDCDMAQGYLFSRAVTAEEVPGLLARASLA
jgi:diguanylate cyclase (GGDEF)-like protein